VEEKMSAIPEFRNVIGGEVRPALSGKTFDSINPATGEVWAKVAASDKNDVEDAVQAAAKAFPAWSNMPALYRGFFLRQIGQMFVQNNDELLQLERNAIGMSPTVLDNFLTPATTSFLWERAAHLTTEASQGRSVVLEHGKFGFTRREPYGVFAGIVPFNAPIPMAAIKSALALAAGNTIVIKPPEQASPGILRWIELANKILPPGVLNVVAGFGADVGDPLVRHPLVRKISMTGSPGTAKMIQRSAADNLTSSIFELGGKSPNIVFADADLDKAIKGITTDAIFTTNAGQACVGGSRILVQRPILDEVLKRVEAAAKKIKLGDHSDPDARMGPVISKAQFDKIVGFIEEGKKQTKLVFGGRYGAELVPSKPGGYWIEPTLFLTDNNKLRICQEEIFGPVACVIPFDTEEEAVRISNDAKYGLASGVWTKDMARALRMVRDIHSGNVWVNTYMETRFEMPFQGVKESGYGHDEILDYTYEKSAVLNDF
jgi:aldehyde dehydrogenase (NAD+)